jgi:menaquinone-dependent protoporphyrinogen oxidase
MTNVMVAYATKMGATREIAEAIGDELRKVGIQVTLSNANDVDSLDGYDAAVVGSALYMLRWRPEAIKVLTHQAKRGKRIPIWLYQSGPCDNDSDRTRVPTPKRVLRLATTIGAAPATTFGGRIEPGSAKGFLARKMAKGPMGGDYRDFDVIRQWARGIAEKLAMPTSTPSQP